MDEGMKFYYNIVWMIFFYNNFICVFIGMDCFVCLFVCDYLYSVCYYLRGLDIDFLCG